MLQLHVLFKLSQLSQEGERFSLVSKLHAHQDTTDSLWTCSSYGPNEEFEETDGAK